MKKILLISFAAAVAVASYAQTPKFAHVNYAELVQLMPEADAARAKLSAQTKEFEETYKSMIDEYHAKLEQYQQKAESWTVAIRQSKERELSEFQNRIQDFQQTAQGELQQSQQAEMAPVYKKASETVEKLAKAAGYIYVFDKGSILYIDAAQSTDLTPAARKALGIPDGRTLESLQAELQAQAQAAQAAQTQTK